MKKPIPYPILLGLIIAGSICLIYVLTQIKRTVSPVLQMNSKLDTTEMDSSSIDFYVKKRALPIYSVDLSKDATKSEPPKRVAISFDAAWGVEDFDEVMQILDKHQVKTTFFMTGDWVRENPEAVKRLLDNGHDLGNHGEHHYDMAKLSKEQMKEEIKLVHDAVYEVTGYEMFLFRPPYGSYNNSVIEIAYESGYYPVQWNVDSLDWKDYGVDDIIQRVCKSETLHSGSIILLHNGATYTVKALDPMLTNLETMGYEIVPISELIYRNEYHMDAIGTQIPNE